MRFLTLLTSGAKTTSSNSGPYEMEEDKLAITLDVTAASGTFPTLDVVVEDSADGNAWTTLSSFARNTAVGVETIRITNPFHKFIRVKYTIGGTSPSFDFSVKTTAK